jgi:hypothetical protein
MQANLATREIGAEVLMATCYDERHPPAAILDPYVLLYLLQRVARAAAAAAATAFTRVCRYV